MRGLPWTTNDIQMLKLCTQYRTPIKKTAQLLNRTPTAVNKTICRLNLRKNSKQNKTVANKNRGAYCYVSAATKPDAS
jgi:hypothetical protein